MRLAPFILVTPLLVTACSSCRSERPAQEQPAHPTVVVSGGSGEAAPLASDPADSPAAGAGASGRLIVGHYRACFVRPDARVVCWGPELVPTLVAGLDSVVAIAGDAGDWCARRKGGDVVCWKESVPLFGLDPGPQEKVPQPKKGLHDVADLALACMLRSNGTVACWDDKGLHDVTGLDRVRRLSVHSGPSTGYVVDGNGRVGCWGLIYAPQPRSCDGTPARTDQVAPHWLTVPGVVQVDHDNFVGGACAVTAGGALWCWGGEHGAEPRQVQGITDVVQVAVAEYHWCARHRSGEVTCSGGNTSGQLGYPEPDAGEGAAEGEALRRVPGLAAVVDVQVGGGEPCGGCGSSCAQTAGGAIWCWGAIGGDKPASVPVAKAR